MGDLSDNFSDAIMNGFPSKYSTLPRISDPSSTDLIPYKRNLDFDRQSKPLTPDVVEKLSSMETRLNITEKSNRALLEEVIRLHNEFRTTAKYYEDAFKEERKIRSLIENHWKNSEDQIRELEGRLRSTEDMLSQEKNKLRDLASLSKNVEEQIFSNKKDHSLLNERQLAKLSYLEKEMNNLVDDRQKLERISFQLVDEMKTIKGKLESQGYDFNAITSELRNKSKKMEDSYQYNIDAVKKHLDRNDVLNNDSTYRSLVEQRLQEMKDYISQIRTWHDSEVSERRNLEQLVLQKFSEISHTMNEHTRNREEAIRQLQYLLREKDHKSETERLALQNKVAEIIESINSKVLEKDLKIKEEQLRRQADLEKLLRTEQETRLSYEREMRLENERRLDSLRQLQAEELSSIKDSVKHDKMKYIESVKRLDEALSLLERQIDENKNEATKILAAEVKSRTSREKIFSDRIIEVEEKITAATSALQFAMSGIADKTIPNNEKLKKLVEDALYDYKASNNRQIADLDARIINLQNLSSRGEVDVDGKIKEAIAKVNNSLKEKIESISLWQGSVNSTLEELKIQKQQLKQEIYELNETMELFKSEMNSRISGEITARMEAVDVLREEIEKLKNSIPQDVVTKPSLEKVKVTTRKLAETMQTVKTVLGMKIQSEQKLRIEEIKRLQDQLIELQMLVEPLIHRRMLPRIFVKNDGDADQSRDERELNASLVNTWSIYNAKRWLEWKSRWMYVKWLVSNRQKSIENPENLNPQTNSQLPAEPTHPWDGPNAKPESNTDKNQTKDNQSNS